MSRSQRGAASLLAVAMLSVLLLVGAALGVVVAMVWAHRTAQAAADLSALAGAAELQDGESACGAAGRIAGANHASLTSCRVQGEEVVVEVMVTGPRWLGQDADLSARARAGPG
ncbi:MAG TPA: Rv3654c family TadE-like protein [Nocardioides sp.]|nr:Rv3654c family TadE-like protein [Nocardioides sp.]